LKKKKLRWRKNQQTVDRRRRRWWRRRRFVVAAAVTISSLLLYYIGTCICIERTAIGAKTSRGPAAGCCRGRYDIFPGTETRSLDRDGEGMFSAIIVRWWRGIANLLRYKEYREIHVTYIYNIIVGVCGRTYCRRDRDVTVGTDSTTTHTHIYTLHVYTKSLSLFPSAQHTHIYMRKSSRLSPLSAQCKSVRVRARARVLSARGNLLLFIYFTIILFAHDHRRRRRRLYIPKLSKHENRERTRLRRRIYFK